MAGADNLKGHGFDERSAEEARECGRKGGIASGQARRRKKAMRTMLNEMLSKAAPENKRAILEKAGLGGDDDTWQAVLLAAMMDRASKGNVGAMQLIVQLSGDDPYVQTRKAEVKVKQDELKLKQQQFEVECQRSKEDDYGDQIDAAFEYDAAREEIDGQPD